MGRDTGSAELCERVGGLPRRDEIDHTTEVILVAHSVAVVNQEREMEVR